MKNLQGKFFKYLKLFINSANYSSFWTLTCLGQPVSDCMCKIGLIQQLPLITNSSWFLWQVRQPAWNIVRTSASPQSNAIKTSESVLVLVRNPGRTEWLNQRVYWDEVQQTLSTLWFDLTDRGSTDVQTAAPLFSQVVKVKFLLIGRPLWKSLVIVSEDR